MSSRAELVDEAERAARRVPEERGRLVHLELERREVVLHVVARADPREQPVADRHVRRVRRHRVADLRELDEEEMDVR